MMKLSELLVGFPEISQTQRGLDPVISGLSEDARKIQLGFLFVAIKGATTDGHQYIPQAIENGAAVLVVENENAVPVEYNGLILKAKDSRSALLHFCQKWFGDPSKNLKMIGVTGTNGKTSITYMLEHVLNGLRCPTGVIGTIDHHLGHKVWPSDLTTPGPVDLAARLSQMKEAGASAVAMEVSSHALDQRRVGFIDFDISIFTNLTRDHLDYHKDMRSYFQAKEKLFWQMLDVSQKQHKYAIINVDDSWGRKVKISSTAKCLTYGTADFADFRFKVNFLKFGETEFDLFYDDKKWSVNLPVMGLHNVYNIVAVIAACVATGYELSAILDCLKSFSGVPGRLQMVKNSKGVHAFVDYAHTPDALENVLKSLQKIRDSQSNTQDEKSRPQIITVFGCGGDRDKGKRPLMAKVAEQFSDQVIVTSDNPRTEDAFSILRDITQGFSKGADSLKVHLEIDRRQAIHRSMKVAKSGDVVLVAGKGHEDYQIIGKEKQPFDDVKVIQET